MSSSSRKQLDNKKEASKSTHFLVSIIRFVTSFFREYLRLRIWAIVIPLLIVIFMGKLFTKDGLLVISIIVVYIVLSYLDKWFENHKEK